MKLTKEPCKIVGIRVGEFRADLLTGIKLSADFILLRDPEKSEGLNAGK